MKSGKQRVRLEVVTAPEIGKGMVGVVLDHPHHAPGTEVSTSPVLAVRENMAETKTFIYELVQR